MLPLMWQMIITYQALKYLQKQPNIKSAHSRFGKQPNDDISKSQHKQKYNGFGSRLDLYNRTEDKRSIQKRAKR